LIALHQIGMIDVLSQLAAAVIVPAAVEQELVAGRTAGHDVPEISGIDWITIRSPASRPTLPGVSQLDAGESEVLWVALETSAIAVLDEVPARRAAAQLGIAFTGTLGLLVDAKKRGLVAKVAPLLDELELHEFHMSQQVRAAILRAAGESP
jgi:hypothetical protein